MRLNDKLKVREIAGEQVIIMQGKDYADMTKVISLNATSKYLWESLSGKDFDIKDIVALLTDKFDVTEELAKSDAQKWLDKLLECGAIQN